ncbi:MULTISPECIES: TetR/AcrR family transcriptional regulator [Pseudoalteromonas]|uniref:TetR/AcrR family transcriptional regulator n=1 Tax=Pseudoalteromonas TaxID=53246 RepID=UPI000F649AA5|nr:MULTISPECIES: TetR/AcrR family transcriptional regulator [Pseudoalteromonas]NKC18265.1 TetR family transcriptional regulator [Pseudoalteromonas galatheae]RRS07159.1 TetR/AcrR family transcriptional regulator [Pseudoalteromonas sp. J010]
MSTKRQQLIDCAMELFYQHGIHAIGINEVLKSSGIAKKTLYNHFESKDALVLATLEQRHHQFISWLSGCLEDVQTSEMLEKQLFLALDQWINNKVEVLGEFRGCYFINTAAEFGELTSPINQLCQRHKLAVKALLKQSLNNADDAAVERLFLLSEGIISTAYTCHDASVAKRAAEFTS